MQNFSESSISLLISDHRFFIGFKSEDWDGNCRTWLLFLLSHFCVDFDVCLDNLLLSNLPTTKTQLLSKGNQIFCQDFLVFCSINCSIASIPGPLAAKHFQNINDPSLYLTVDMRFFSLYALHFAAKHVDGMYGQNVQFCSYLVTALSSSHNFNEVWQTPDAWYCIMLLSKGCLHATLPKSLLVWRHPFYGFFSELVTKTQPISAILNLWSLCNFMASLTIFLAVRWDNMHLHPLPGMFATISHVLHYCIIALTVLGGTANGLHVYFCTFYTHYQTCESQLPSLSSEVRVLWLFPCWWLTKVFCMLVTFLYSSETRSDGMTNNSSFRLRLTKWK